MSNVSRREAGPVLLGADMDNSDTETQDSLDTRKLLSWIIWLGDLQPWLFVVVYNLINIYT